MSFSFFLIGIAVYSETKYYSASVQVLKSKNYTSQTSTELPINGVIFYNSFSQAKEIADKSESFQESDVRLFCTKVDPTKEMHEWAISNQEIGLFIRKQSATLLFLLRRN